MERELGTLAKRKSIAQLMNPVAEGTQILTGFLTSGRVLQRGKTMGKRKR